MKLKNCIISKHGISCISREKIIINPQKNMLYAYVIIRYCEFIMKDIFFTKIEQNITDLYLNTTYLD